MQRVAVVPAYQSAHTVGGVVRELLASWPGAGGIPRVVVVDDGSTDETAEVAREAGADVVRHHKNRGKGAALRTGLERAHELGATVAVSVDADRQHPAEEAVRLALEPAPLHALLLGVRDLMRDGAPRANQFSNGFSNWWVSRFSGRWLADTQCGLRRYPVGPTLRLGARSRGFGFEAEVIVRAASAGWTIAQIPVRVIYPADRTSHFHTVRDPARIVGRLLYTYATARRAR
jgi:glycosyltransferase involved in cell wall biosynthesis